MLGPNIIGNIKARTQGGTCDGVFSFGGSFQGINGVSYNPNGVWFSFSLKKFNSIYSGDTLQPSAFQTLIIIKFWKAGGWTVEDAPNSGELLWAEKLYKRLTKASPLPPFTPLPKRWTAPYHPSLWLSVPHPATGNASKSPVMLG